MKKSIVVEKERNAYGLLGFLTKEEYEAIPAKQRVVNRLMNKKYKIKETVCHGKICQGMVMITLELIISISYMKERLSTVIFERQDTIEKGFDRLYSRFLKDHEQEISKID